MRALQAFETGHCVATKMMTVPALPLREARSCSLPSASGSLKSGKAVPMAGPAFGAGVSAAGVSKAASAAKVDESAMIATAKSFFITLPELLLPCLEVERRLQRELADGLLGVSPGWTVSVN